MSKTTPDPQADTEADILDENEAELTELSSRERQFCEQLSLGMTKRQAAKLAKYRQPTQAAGRLLKRPRVRAYLKELYDDATEKTKLTRDHVVEGMQSAIEDAKLQGDCTAQIAGWREIGKILGIYAVERKEVNVVGHLSNTQQQLSIMDEKMLLELAGPDAIEGEFTIVDE